ncbi:DUF2795 domain-containing protein [Nocardia thailandica]|uniref:DUF2795 domain-containing protein n=1 Tax=Nocardia thailandica TaxID=257275 RepID=UPI0002ED4648|nr:DUF2795 domain-containing protein [Nocardia thailandica]
MPTPTPIEIQRCLGAVDYPCDRDGLVAAALSNGAGNDIVDTLEALPARTFEGPDDLGAALR